LDVVVEQDPLSGYQVTEGTLVNLTINRTERGPIRDRGLRLFHHRVGKGFLKRRIQIRVHAYGMVYQLHNTFERPGESLWFVTPSGPDVEVFIYEDGRLLGRHSWFPDPALNLPELEMDGD
jgi:hypothetical protein